MGTDIAGFDDWTTSHGIPLIYDDTMTSIEILGAIKQKINEMIAKYNDVDGRLTTFLSWVNTTLNSHAIDQLEAWKNDGTLSDLINGALWDTFRSDMVAMVDDKLADVDTQLSANINTVNSRILEMDASVTTALGTQNQAITNQLATQDATISAQLSGQDADIDGKITQQNNSVNENLALIEAHIATQNTTINTRIASLPTFLGASRLILAVDEAARNALAGAAQNGDVWIKPTVADTSAPNPVTSLNATPGIGQVSLSWVLPNNTDLSGVKVLRKTGSYPVNSADGTVVYTGGGVAVTDVGLNAGTTYYYSVFAYDTSLNYSTAANASATPAGLPVSVFTMDYSGGALNDPAKVTLGQGCIVTGNELVLTGNGATDGLFKSALPIPSPLSLNAKYRGTTYWKAGTANALSIVSAIGDGANWCVSCYYNSARGLCLSFKDSAGANEKRYNWGTNTWQAATDAANEYLSTAVGLVKHFLWEIEDNAGAPRWRFIMQDASGVVQYTTPWNLWSATYHPNAQFDLATGQSYPAGAVCKVTLLKVESY